jgi:hypothetical protein
MSHLAILLPGILSRSKADRYLPLRLDEHVQETGRQ